MKFALAALLLLIPSAIHAQEESFEEEDLRSEVIVSSDTDPITVREMEQRFALCVMYITGQAEPSRIIEIYELDTPRKRRDWEMQCQLTGMGIDVGYKTANRENTNNTNTTGRIQLGAQHNGQ